MAMIAARDSTLLVTPHIAQFCSTAFGIGMLSWHQGSISTWVVTCRPSVQLLSTAAATWQLQCSQYHTNAALAVSTAWHTRPAGLMSHVFAELPVQLLVCCLFWLAQISEAWFALVTDLVPLFPKQHDAVPSLGCMA
jgi:hypothetical protein